VPLKRHFRRHFRIWLCAQIYHNRTDTQLAYTRFKKKYFPDCQNTGTLAHFDYNCYIIYKREYRRLNSTKSPKYLILLTKYQITKSGAIVAHGLAHWHTEGLKVRQRLQIVCRSISLVRQ
jgi:hypothetical protein